MAEIKSQKETAEDWLNITRERLQAQIKRLRIGSTNELVASIKGTIQEEAGGDVEKIRLAYAYYGMFVDMGVGKGTKLGEKKDQSDERRLLGSMASNHRKAKKWSTKPIANETHQLSRIMAELYGNKGLAMIQSAIASTVPITL